MNLDEKQSYFQRKGAAFLRSFLLIFIVLQPVFDCYYFYTDELASMIGFTIPPLLAVFCVALMLLLYLVMDLHHFTQRETLLLFAYFALCIVYFVIHHITNATFNSVVPGDFGYSMINEAYYVVRLILPFIILFLTYQLSISRESFYRVLEILCLLISGTIVLSNLFKISLSSYTNEVIKDNIFAWFTNNTYRPVELTSKGFFSYANQISALMMFLFPVMLYRMTDKFCWWRVCIVIAQALAMIMIGTKTAAYGVLLELGTFALVMLFSALVQKKLNRATLRRYRGAILTICVALILSGVILQKSPVLQKQVERQQSIAERVKKEGTMKIEEEDEYYQLSFEDRVQYIEDSYYAYSLQEDFVKKSYPYEYDPDFWYEILKEPLANRLDYRFLELAMINHVVEINHDPMDKWFGISATRETNIFKVERDYIAQYYSMGIVGVVIFMVPFVVLAIAYSLYSIWKKNWDHIFENLSLSMALDVVLLIGLITGNCLDGLFMTVVLGFFSGRLLLNVAQAKRERS